MSRRLKRLSVVAIVAALMAVSAQAATGFDLTTGLAGDAGHMSFPEPATMMVLGMVLLATFRGPRHA
jgi:hypothetical protein